MMLRDIMPERDRKASFVSLKTVLCEQKLGKKAWQPTNDANLILHGCVEQAPMHLQIHVRRLWRRAQSVPVRFGRRGAPSLSLHALL